jgi:hypothetical protein
MMIASARWPRALAFLDCCRSKFPRLSQTFLPRFSLFNLFNRFNAFNFICGFAALCVFVAVSGCVSKKKADEQAHAAFAAGQQQGQQQAMMARAPQPTGNVVTIVGPVKVPSMPWTQNLTLARAIVNCGYQSPVDPKQIMIVRNGQAVPIDPKNLLAGEDIPLLPGDMVVLQP